MHISRFWRGSWSASGEWSGRPSNGSGTSGVATHERPPAQVGTGPPGAVRRLAREYAKLYLGLRNYTQNLVKFGFTAGDLADGGSDRLIDAVIPQGSAEQIAGVVRAHLEAGADHVCLQPLGEEGIPRHSWTALAKVLID